MFISRSLKLVYSDVMRSLADELRVRYSGASAIVDSTRGSGRPFRCVAKVIAFWRNRASLPLASIRRLEPSRNTMTGRALRFPGLNREHKP
jgi:hypothetical protein